ncbi:MAG TPA: tRNA glutamyl-Q(34) synthetase GluQRS, partial [Ktedonobacterales bacterium]|nr:tRNA glutamyl-Q(34) synthetase GluQRS [Ktedonobacterales bacterium]
MRSRGRYAPSPTGTLHLGNLRTALLAWLFARAAGGAFILRMEDLDAPRVRPGAASQLLADLRWLGLDWDEGPDVGGPLGPYTQSARQAIYAAALAQLRADDLVYPCYCTRAELRARHEESGVASAPHGMESVSTVVCPCRGLTYAEQRMREVAGRRPAWRFHTPSEPVTFTDRIIGAVTQRPTDAGDFIVRRSDGLFAYHLAVVIDDALMGITQVVRGADLSPFVAAQQALCLALGYSPPREY